MQDLVASGRIVDLILLLLAAEVVALLVYRRMTGRGLAPVSVLATLLPGACLLLALRAALTGASTMVLVCLLAALIFHLADLWLRQPKRTKLT